MLYNPTVVVNLDGNPYEGLTVVLNKGAAYETELEYDGDVDAYTTEDTLPDGTYTVWVDGVDTEKTLEISSTNNTATVNYYTLSLTAGTGTSSPTGDGIYLEGATANIGVSLTGGYTWSKWTAASGTTDDVSSQSATFAVTKTLSLTATTTVTAQTVTVTVMKDDLAWNSSGLVITLEPSVGLPIATTPGGNTYTASVTPPDTYKILVDDVETGVTVTVGIGSAGNATLNYYTLTLVKGTGIDDVYGAGIYLEGEEVEIDADLTATYSWVNWVADPAGFGNESQKDATVTMPGYALELTATGSATTYTATVNVLKDGAAWNNSGLTLSLNNGAYALAYASGNSYTAGGLANGTYTVYAGSVNTGATVMIDGAGGSASINYYTLAFGATDEGDADGSYVTASNGMTTGDAVLSGTEVTLTAAGDGPGTQDYTYLWDDTSATEGAVLVVTVTEPTSAYCEVTGTARVTPSVTLTKDGGAYSGQEVKLVSLAGEVELTEDGSTGVYEAAEAIAQGEYAVYVNGVDTGETLTLTTTATSVTLDYFTVEFAVVDAGTAAGSTVSATYGGEEVTSGDVVLGGKTLVVTAVGKYAATFTYEWDDEEETEGAVLTVEELAAAVDVTCTVTGEGESEPKMELADPTILCPLLTLKKGSKVDLATVIVFTNIEGRKVMYEQITGAAAATLSGSLVTYVKMGVTIIRVSILESDDTFITSLDIVINCV